ACSGKLKPTRRVDAEHWWTCDIANESPRWSPSSSMVRTHRVRARDRGWDMEGPWICTRGSAMMSVMQTIC
ncbi:hypothetical protein PAXINDRAFT_168690, partial [Paxillus involutus ATCC 200175]